MHQQDPAHGQGGDVEEMGPAFPGEIRLADQAQKGLMDQGGGLEGSLRSWRMARSAIWRSSA
jgi:hypothetical protein